MIAPDDIPASHSESISYSIEDGLKFIQFASKQQWDKLSLEELEILENNAKKVDKVTPISTQDKISINIKFGIKIQVKRIQKIKQISSTKQKKKKIILAINFAIMLFLNIFYYLGLAFCLGPESISIGYMFISGSIKQIKTSELHLPQWQYLGIYLILYIGHGYCHWKGTKANIEQEKIRVKIQQLQKIDQVFSEELRVIFDIQEAIQ